MNDQYFELWSNELPELRQARVGEVQTQIQEKGSEFKPKEFFELYQVHMDRLLMKWWELERKSWEENPPADASLAIDNLKTELESVIEFEINSIDEELTQIRGGISWHNSDVDKGKKNLFKFLKDLNGNYSRKIDSMTGKSPEKTKGVAPSSSSPRPRVVVSSGGNTSGGSMFFMFFLGLLLGGGAAFYFWDQGVRAEKQYQRERTEWTSEKNNIVNEMALLGDTYYQLVNGKIKTIPELQKIISPIKEKYRAQRENAENQLNQKQASLRKRIPEGDRLDRSLEKLQEAHDKIIAGIKIEEENRLKPHLEQLKLHEELLRKSGK